MDATENHQKDGEEDEAHLDGGESVNTVREWEGFWYKVMGEVVYEWFPVMVDGPSGK